MSRWIVFDEQTAGAVETFTGVRPEKRTGPEAVMAALATGSPPVVAVLPAGARGKVLLMRVRRPQPDPPPARPDSHLAPAGFLGLTDTIDMDSEPEPPQTWWRKILG